VSELSAERLVAVTTELADDKKAIDIVELAVRDAVGIHQGLKGDHGLLPRRVEGLTESRWVLMDYLDVVVHIFTPEARDFYRLEQLWGEVPARAVGTA
jgi:ribosome-associated protein